MGKKIAHPSDDPAAKPQIERFRETARALGADEDEDRFWDKLRVIARQKPKAEPKAAANSKPKIRHS